MIHSPDIQMDFAMDEYLKGNLNRELEILDKVNMTNPDYILSGAIQNLMRYGFQSGGAVPGSPTALQGDPQPGEAEPEPEPEPEPEKKKVVKKVRKVKRASAE